MFLQTMFWRHDQQLLYSNWRVSPGWSEWWSVGRGYSPVTVSVVLVMRGTTRAPITPRPDGSQQLQADSR